MPPTIDDIIIHYIFSTDPRNRAFVDIKNKKTGEHRYIKIRHRLSQFYAISLVDPMTFDICAETQVKSVSSRQKPIVIHDTVNTSNKDIQITLYDASRISLEWNFEWQGERLKWVYESKMSSSLECRVVRKTGDICVAQYLPRILKDEYFGIFSLLGYNIVRCGLTHSRELELIILTSLMTLLDKSDGGNWKKDSIELDLGEYDDTWNKPTSPTEIYDDPLPHKALQKKQRMERINEQKLQVMLEKDAKRSNKQLLSDQKKRPLSNNTSPTRSPSFSPIPSPSVSAHHVTSNITKQKSAVASNNDTSTSGKQITASNISSVKVTDLFNSITHSRQLSFDQSSGESIKANNYTLPRSVTLSDRDHKNNYYTHRRKEVDYSHHNQLSLPYGKHLARLTNEMGKLSINTSNPPSVRSIRWNPEPIHTGYYSQGQSSYNRNHTNNKQSGLNDRVIVSDYPF
ncbi:hypothetical protein BDB01DRAFT_838692 [Pilobolus umbonatus]|nr:hypothetical protein BDB01DRAFT_838692 [Pilobolus umbonatus]